MEWLFEPQTWISLLTLTVLEIVLGIDNIIFISILAGKLPKEQQGKARAIGLMLALVTRLILLSFIFLLTRLTADLFHLFGHGFSGKDLVMFFGGLFLMWKSVKEIHHSLEGVEHEQSSKVKASFSSVIGTIVFVDILFSLDSVITAVGLVGSEGGGHGGGHGPTGPGAMIIMITAIIISMIVMLAAAGSISDFVNRHPTIKMLALSFLILVGFVLMADGFGHHVPKGYIYFGMAFSFVVEMLNIRMRSRKAPQKPVELHKEY